jgi:hypothetical protein
MGKRCAGGFCIQSDANFGYTRMYSAVEQLRLDENLGTDFLGIPGTMPLLPYTSQRQTGETLSPPLQAHKGFNPLPQKTRRPPWKRGTKAE